MFRRLLSLLGASVLLASTAPAAASSLSDAAAALQPGQWRVLNRAGDGTGFDYNLINACQPGGCYDNILNYADKAMWNPALREIEFIGKGHMAEHKHISYSEATNRWSLRTRPNWACGVEANCYGMGHGYEHSANNPATGDVYARRQSSGDVYKWTRATGSWAQLALAPVLEIAIAIEYFPEMGGLLMAGTRNNVGELHIYRESTKSWSQLAGGLPMGPYHNHASYNPVHKIVVFGGGNGSSQLHKVDAAGKVTQIASAPIEVRIKTAIFTVDPASGRYLLFGNAGGFYQYDVPTNTWSSVSTANVPLFAPSGERAAYRVAVPISTHGVLAFLVEGGTSDTRELLYRHAPAAPAPPIDTTPPAPPAGLIVK